MDRLVNLDPRYSAWGKVIKRLKNHYHGFSYVTLSVEIFPV